ncbi:MAG: hypothetical protein WCK46_01290 [Candidatus Adlerbacteria bacterium]
MRDCYNYATESYDYQYDVRIPGGEGRLWETRYLFACMNDACENRETTWLRCVSSEYDGNLMYVKFIKNARGSFLGSVSLPDGENFKKEFPGLVSCPRCESKLFPFHRRLVEVTGLPA